MYKIIMCQVVVGGGAVLVEVVVVCVCGWVGGLGVRVWQGTAEKKRK